MHDNPFVGFFRFLFIELWTRELPKMLQDWPLGTIVGMILIAVAIAVVLLALWGVFTAVDSWFLPRRRTTGVITGKHYTAPYTTTHFHTVGKVMVPQTTHHPEQHDVTIAAGSRSDTISVTKEYWVSAREGDEVTIEYVDGRLSGRLYIKELFAQTAERTLHA